MSITLHFASVAAARRDDRYDIDAKYSETAEGTNEISIDPQHVVSVSVPKNILTYRNK